MDTALQSLLLEGVNWKHLPGPENITRVELENGIVILVRSNFNSPSIVMLGYLPSGSLFDPPDKLGLSYFTSIALMRGSKRRSFHEIYDSLESIGASCSFISSVHNVHFGGRALVEDLPVLLTALSESICEPIFPPEQVERLRSQMLTGLAIRAQSTSDMASLIFDEKLFRNHPYGKPEDGFIETVQRISRQDLVDFHKKYYGPNKMVISVVGAISPQQVIDEITHFLGDWKNPEQVSAAKIQPILPLESTIREHLTIPGKYQTDLVMGTLGPKRNSDDYLPVSLGNSVLGQFGMMGRIGDVVREREGLAYHASTNLNSWIEYGSWEVSAGVNPANLQRAIDLIIGELKRFVSEPVLEQELQDSQQNFICRLPLSLESNSGIAGALLNLECFDLGLDYYLRYPNMVAEITPAIVLEAARRYIDIEKICIVSAGPGENL